MNPSLPLWPIALLLLTPLTAVYVYDPESCRLLVDALSMTAFAGTAFLAARRGTLPALARGPAWAAAAFASILFAQAWRAQNLPAATAPLALHLGGLFAMLALASSAELRERLSRVLPWIVPVVTWAVALAGFAGHLGRFPAPLFGQITPRPASLFVNSNYGGTFAALLLPLSAAAFVRSGRSGTTILTALGLALLAGYLTLSGSRGAWIGTAVAGTVLAALALHHRRRGTGIAPSKRLLAALGLMAAGIGLAFHLMHDEHREEIQEHTASGANWRLRVAHWNSALALYSTRPLTGIGLGNFPIQIHPLWAAKDLQIRERPWEGFPLLLRDPHNTYVNVLVELGPAGLLAFLALPALAGWTFLRSWPRSPRSEGDVWTWAWAGCLAAFLVSSAGNTLSNYVSHSAYAYVALGMLAGGASTTAGRLVLSKSTLLAVTGALAAVLLVATTFATLHFPARYYRLCYKGDPEDLDRAARLKSWDALEFTSSGFDLFKARRYDLAAKEIRRGLALEPLDANAWALLGDACSRRRKPDEAEAAYAQAIGLVPTWPYPRLQHGALLQSTGRFQEAVASFRSTLATWPGYAAAHYFLGSTLARLEDYGGAVAAFQAARALGYPVGPRLDAEILAWKLRPEFREFFEPPASPRHP